MPFRVAERACFERLKAARLAAAQAGAELALARAAVSADADQQQRLDAAVEEERRCAAGVSAAYEEWQQAVASLR